MAVCVTWYKSKTFQLLVYPKPIRMSIKFYRWLQKLILPTIPISRALCLVQVFLSPGTHYLPYWTLTIFDNVKPVNGDVIMQPHLHTLPLFLSHLSALIWLFTQKNGRNYPRYKINCLMRQVSYSRSPGYRLASSQGNVISDLQCTPTKDVIANPFFATVALWSLSTSAVQVYIIIGK